MHRGIQLFYRCILAPFGVLRRCTGRPLFTNKRRADTSTYWVVRSAKERAPRCVAPRSLSSEVLFSLRRGDWRFAGLMPLLLLSGRFPGARRDQSTEGQRIELPSNQYTIH